MKVAITHLKAPWPLGAVVGDVLDLSELPTWAVGKFKLAPDDAEVTLDMPEQVEGDGSGQDKFEQLSDNERALLAQVETQLQAHRELQDQHADLTRAAAEVRTKVNELEARLEAQAVELDDLRASEQHATARVAELEEQLAALQDKPADTAADAPVFVVNPEEKPADEPKPAKGKGKGK